MKAEQDVARGSFGDFKRSSMAAMAVAPMSAHGWWMVVSGTESRLAYFTSSTPAIRTVVGHGHAERVERLQQLARR